MLISFIDVVAGEGSGQRRHNSPFLIFAFRKVFFSENFFPQRQDLGLELNHFVRIFRDNIMVN